MVVARSQGEEESYYLVGTDVKVLEMEGGDGCPAVCMHSVLLNDTPKNSWDGKCCSIYFTAIKIITFKGHVFKNYTSTHELHEKIDFIILGWEGLFVFLNIFRKGKC
jgi:hypothetical protein